MHRRTAMFTALVALLLLTGCYASKALPGGRTEYTVAWWVPALLAVCGVGLLVGAAMAANLVRKAITLAEIPNHLIQIKALVFLVLSGFMVLSFIPRVVIERLVVSDRGYTVSEKRWVFPQPKTTTFTDLTSLTVRVEVVNGQNGPVENYHLDALYKTGETDTTPLHESLIKVAAPDIFRRAKAKGVVVVGEDLLPSE